MITYNQARVIMWDDPESSAPSGTTVSSISALNNAIASASAGSVIRLQNGTYNNAWIDINGRHGSPGNPIKIFAATPGQVFLTGRSQLTVRGQSTWVLVNGFVFRNGFLNENNRYVAPGAPASIEFNCRWCRLTNISIVSYNGATAVYSTWLWTRGFFNRIDHCYLRNKTTANAMIKVRRTQSISPESCRVDHNRLIDFKTNAQEGNEEAIQIGQAERWSAENANCITDHNWIDGFDNPGEDEVISVKTSQGVYYRNLVKNHVGHAFVLRHGHRTWLEGNVVIGGGEGGSGGIRVGGSDVTLINNYFVDINPSNFSNRFGIQIHGARPGYDRVVRAEIAHNTWINTNRTIMFGTGQDTGPPLDVRWRSNSIDAQGKTIVSGPQYVANQNTWQTNHFFWGNGSLGISNPGNIGNNSNPGYSLTGGLYRMASNSVLINSAAKLNGVIFDFERQLRGNTPTIGCDEFSSPVGNGPLNINETGPTYDISGL